MTPKKTSVVSSRESFKMAKKNLSEDKQLSGALNPQLYVPIATLMQLASVKVTAEGRSNFYPSI